MLFSEMNPSNRVITDEMMSDFDVVIKEMAKERCVNFEIDGEVY